jgi:hypothetical protein
MTSGSLVPRLLLLLVPLLAVLAAIAAGSGVLTRDGAGPSTHVSVHGLTVTLYGAGLYRHMSADVAVQGIAQDCVTLVVGIPVLLVALWRAHRGSRRGLFLLAGVLGYFFVTYLFYLAMAAYNAMFLVYAGALCASFFALAVTLLSLGDARAWGWFAPRTPTRAVGGFLVANSAAIAVLWLGIVIPPLADGSVVPTDVAHYTTLIVQGFDLGLLLPLGVVCGVLLWQRRPYGYLLATPYMVFLSLLMLALVAKVAAMAIAGVSVVPVVFIIPTLCLISVIGAAALLVHIGPVARAHDPPDR